MMPALALGRSGGRAPGWLPAVALLLATSVVGPSLGAMARPLFVAACGAVGFVAWRQSAAAHVQTALILFVFSPFVRRLVDLSAGFDPQGLMLTGPLLAILAPGETLVRLLLADDRQSANPAMAAVIPALIVAACVLYGTLLTLAQGETAGAASGSIKWFAPLVYALALRARGGAGLPDAIARAFLVILPVVGVYGVYQYVNPPEWDRFWMTYASITSAGVPEPFGVRVFGTLNSPASYATFIAAGMLLVGFLRPGWQVLLAVLPAALGLLLSLYRTAWLSLAVSVLFCLLFRSTRTRAAAMIGALIGAIIVAGTLTPFAEVITDRLATLGQGSQDGSGAERLGELIAIWNQPDSGLIGAGFVNTDVGVAGAMPIDGMIVSCWVFMGIVVGLICLVGLLGAAGQAIAAARRLGTREAVVLGGLAASALVQLPLAGIASGELGFLFWTFIALAWLERPGAR